MNDLADLNAAIRSVTVHSDGAEVVRQADLDALPTRPTRLRVTGLPLAAAGRPLRARVVDGGAEVLSCRLAALPVETAQAEDDALSRACEQAEDAVEAAEARCTTLLARLRALASLDPPPRPKGEQGKAPPPSPAAARLELLRFRDRQAERLAADLAAARVQAEEARERLAEAEATKAQAEEAQAARAGELRLAADLLVRWPDSGPAGRVEVVYIVPGARWAPSYILRFDRSLDRVEVVLRGVVAQCSGEDWRGVRIACATAPLQTWHVLPSLPGRRIGRAQPSTPAWRPPPSGTDALFADFDRFATDSPVERLDADAEEQDYVVLEDCAESEMPPPAPAEMMMERSKSKKSSSSLGRSGGGAAIGAREEADDERQAPGDAPVAKRMAAPTRNLAPPPPPSGEPGADLLDFASLHLPDAEQDGRGRPRAGSGFWAKALSQSARQADRLAPPPPGHDPVAPSAFAARWEGPLPVEVPGDGAWHVVPLATASTATSCRLVVVPRDSRNAFRNAAITNPFDRAIASGPADVYLGEDYLLETRLPATGPAARFDLGLGVEQGVAIARNASFAEVSAGLLGGSLRLSHEVRIAVHSKLQRAMTVEVRERLPQPDAQVEHCTVKELRCEPPWESWHPDDGGLPGGRRWTLDLAAGERRELIYAYHIEIPAKNQLVGGNRREA